MRALVVARMGYDPFVPDHATVVSVSVREIDGFVGTLVLAEEGLEASRTLRAGDCHSVVEALATAIGLALDPLGLGRAPRPPAAPLNAPEEPIELPPVLRPREPPPNGPRAALMAGFVATLAARGGLGAAPSPTVGADLGVGFAWDSLRVLAELRVWSTPGAVSAGVSRVVLSETTAGASACAVLGLWTGCAGMDVGVRRIEADAVSEPGPFESLAASGRVRSGIRVALPPAALTVELELAVPLAPVTLEVAGQPVWSTLPINGALLVGVAVEP